jgi:DNA-binding NarL/FixJ family response regulator
MLRDQPTVTVTHRQAQVLTGLFCGLSGTQIARTLQLSHDTVKTHRRRLYAVLGARSAAHAVGLAVSGQVRVLVDVDRWGT